MSERGLVNWLLPVLALAVLPACGGAKSEPKSAEEEKNDERAERSLARARESQDPERYRVIIGRFGDTKAAIEAREDLARIMVARAKKAIAAEEWATAEDNALEAKQYGGVDLTLEANGVLDKIDDTRATKIAESAIAEATARKCASAFKVIAATIRKKPRARYTSEVRKQTEAALLECIDAKLKDAVGEGSIEEARMMIETPDATTAFSNDGYKKAHGLLQKSIVKRSTAELDPLLAQKKYQEAITKLDELRGKELLNAEEREVALDFIRDAIAKDVLAALKAGLTTKNPKEIAAEADAKVTLAAWKAVPDEIREARDLLGVSIECQRLGCTLAPKPAPLWAWGKVPMHQPTSAEGSKKATIAHAQKVWAIGKSKAWALVARTDPGDAKDDALIAKAEGWAPLENLETSDTDEWLPPKDQSAGIVVWGPLLENEKDGYILGTVQSVDGDSLTVKRMTDGLDTKVDWKKVFLGRFPEGLKVEAFCVDQIHRETAKVLKVVSVTGGVPKVKVKCDKGNIERVEIASALTTRAAWLPRRKP